MWGIFTASPTRTQSDIERDLNENVLCNELNCGLPRTSRKALYTHVMTHV